MSMNMQRITISLPQYLYQNLLLRVPKGEVSRFVVEALEKEITEVKTNPVDEFIKIKDRLPKKKQGEIIKAIKKGRL